VRTVSIISELGVIRGRSSARGQGPSRDRLESSLKFRGGEGVFIGGRVQGGRAPLNQPRDPRETTTLIACSSVNALLATIDICSSKFCSEGI